MAEDKGKKEKPEDGGKEPKAPPQPPRATNLVVTSSGKNGQYTFDLQVISDQGRGIQARVLVIEGNHSGKMVPTDNEGHVEHQATPFMEEDQEFLFQVVGTDIRQEVILDGPEQPKPPSREKIRPVAGGFWTNFKNVGAKKKQN